MRFRQINNEKGLTLVEVLASLSIFAIVIVSSSTLLIQLTNGEKKVSDSISLQQHTNVLMAEVRNQYYEGESTICFNDEQAIINTAESTIVNGEKTLLISNGCVNQMNFQEPLTLNLNLTNNGHILNVKTTLTVKDNYVLNLQENPDDFTLGDFDEACSFTGDTKFKETTLKNKKNEDCNNKYTVYGSAAFMQDFTVHNKVEIIIKGSFYVFGELDFKGAKVKVCVHNEIITEEAISDYSIKRNADNCFQPEGYDIYVLN